MKITIDPASPISKLQAFEMLKCNKSEYPAFSKDYDCIMLKKLIEHATITNNTELLQMLQAHQMPSQVVFSDKSNSIITAIAISISEYFGLELIRSKAAEPNILFFCWDKVEHNFLKQINIYDNTYSDTFARSNRGQNFER